MKKSFTAPEMKVAGFDADDIITASGSAEDIAVNTLNSAEFKNANNITEEVQSILVF